MLFTTPAAGRTHRCRRWYPGPALRTALIEIVDLLSAGSDLAQRKLAHALGDPHAGSAPERALEHALALGWEDDDACPILEHFDWKAQPPEIREALSTLPTFPPGMSWDWHDRDPLDEDHDQRDPHEELNDFLNSVNLHSSEVGFELIGFWADDSFTLGFVREEELERLEDLGRQAGTVMVPYY